MCFFFPLPFLLTCFPIFRLLYTSILYFLCAKSNITVTVSDFFSQYRCIIVDSTRRGKSMPDALSKTIPIWTAVMNRILFPHVPESHQVTTPPTVVGASEHAQIAARLPDFVQSLQVSLQLFKTPALQTSFSAMTTTDLIPDRHSI
jgi:hypothetical protein